MNALTKQLLSTLMLGGLVMGSALAVVTNIDSRRELFGKMQTQREGRDLVDAQWRKLLLERAALSSQVSVDRVALQRLKMKLPEPDSTVTVTF
ncbi:MAG: cell division protein FtsL [Immundisolibacteraceae bacterium]|nr:cell division protein FtsL [Immundisolibacteraceae bacterium]